MFVHISDPVEDMNVYLAFLPLPTPMIGEVHNFLVRFCRHTELAVKLNLLFSLKLFPGEKWLSC